MRIRSPSTSSAAGTVPARSCARTRRQTPRPWWRTITTPRAETSEQEDRVERADPLRDLDEDRQLDQRHHDEDDDEHETHTPMLPGSWATYASRMSRRSGSVMARAWSVRRSSMRSSWRSSWRRRVPASWSYAAVVLSIRLPSVSI